MTTENQRAPLWCSARLGLAVLGFFGFANLYALRVHLSVALVCMLNHTAIQANANQSAKHYGCAGDNNSSKDSQVNGEFVWDENTQGLVLGAFFWGYLSTQLIGGVLAEKYGGKRVMAVSMMFSAVCTLLCPLAATKSYIWLIILRVCVGMGQGVVFPVGHAMWSHWAPSAERTFLVGFTYAGTQIGNVIAFPVSGIICDQVGWQAVFYVFGALGVIWCCAWFLLVADTPAKHPRISDNERLYIEENISRDQTRKGSIPWLSIVRSPAVWAIVIIHTSANFATDLLLTELPTFMGQVLNFNIASNGLYSALPYLCFFIVIQIATVTADLLRNKKILTTRNVRKLMMIFANGGEALFMVITGYLGCDQKALAVVMLTAAQGMTGFQFAGYLVNHVDIAPRFAGTLMGISNTFATIPGIVAPYVASVLTVDETFEEWRVVFWISAAILLFGLAVYLVIGDGEVQSWAKPRGSTLSAKTSAVSENVKTRF